MIALRADFKGTHRRGYRERREEKDETQSLLSVTVFRLKGEKRFLFKELTLKSFFCLLSGHK
jgi:hypothetical protein